MYKITFTTDANTIQTLTNIKAYPFWCGGREWKSGESLEVESLRPFVENQKELLWNPSLSSEQIFDKELVDSRFTVQKITPENHGEHSEG